MPRICNKLIQGSWIALMICSMFTSVSSGASAAQDAPQVPVPAVQPGGVIESPEQSKNLNQTAKSEGAQILADISQSSWLKNVEMEKGHISLVSGRSQLLRLQRNIARISLSNPEIVDAAILSPTEILLNAKEEGASNIILWDQMNRVTVFDITVTQDPDLLYQVLNRIAPEAKFEIFPSNDVFVIKGEVDSVAKQKEVEKAATAFAEGSVSLVRVATAKQILLKIRFVQLDHSQNYDFGVDAQYLGRTFGPLLRPGGTSAALDTDKTFTPTSGKRAWSTLETPPDSSGVHWFPYYTSDQAVSVFVKAIETKGIGKIIARPNLLASDGQEASFLVGGEAAVVAISNSSVGVDYREFGTRLTFTPDILPSGKIKLTVAPEVSALDFANGVEVNGVSIPSFTTIRTKTVVELGNGETFLIGGLLQQKITISDSGTPFLRRLPLVGKLFDNVSHDYQDTELVVIVTPSVVDPMKQPLSEGPDDDDVVTLATKFDTYKVKDEQREAIDKFLRENQKSIREKLARMDRPSVSPAAAASAPESFAAPVSPEPAIEISKPAPIENLDELEKELAWAPARNGSSPAKPVSGAAISAPTRPSAVKPPVPNISMKAQPAAVSPEPDKSRTAGGGG